MELLKSKSKSETKSLHIFLLFMGIVLVAFNLRPAITAVGPLVGMIQTDIGLAHWSAGLLTSLPLMAFAVISPIVPKVAHRLTNERALLLGLLVLAIGIGIRSITTTFFLFAGTLFVGVGIALCNVLLPVIIKDHFPLKFGLMTSVYSTSMGLFASLASGVSIPLASGTLNLGWQGALVVWGIPTVLAIILWIYLVRLNKGNHQGIKRVRSRDNRIWRSPIAWQVALFMGFQSFLFYVTITWLPEILHHQGMSMERAGWLLSFMQFVGLPFSFLVPVLAGRFRSQQWIVVALGLCTIAGFGGLLLGASYAITIVSIVLMGIGLGGTFPLALTFLGMRAQNARQAAELSGMAQAIGYVLAAIGPLFIGYLYDFTHMWNIPLITLIIVTALLITFGVFAGRDKYVYEN